MLHHRLLFGPVLILLLVGVVWLDEWLEQVSGWPGLILFPLMAIAAIGASIEMSAMFHARGIASSRRLTIIVVLVGLATSGLLPGSLDESMGAAMACTGATLVMLTSFIFYSRRQTTEGVVASVSATLLTFVYIGLMGGFILVLRRDYSAWVVLAVLLVTKSCDIGAYFTGTAIGRHKLIPWLSPGKTWEGLVGGVATSTLIGMVAAMLVSADSVEVHGIRANVAIWHGAVTGAILGLVGQGGDLMASLLKRDAGVKDSSSILPGFGGVLDVIDSPLLAAPVMYWVLAALHIST